MVGLILWTLLFQFQLTVAIDGQWSSWYDWNSCSVSCGGGQQTRQRECNRPEPKHGGKECVGDSDEARTCSTQPCPKWHGWEQWGTCSASCGYGKQTRTRICEQCKNPPRETECISVQNNLCDGLPKETKNCNTTVCLGNLSHSLQLTCDLGHIFYRWEKPQSSQLIIEGYSKIQEIDSLQYHDVGNYTCGGYNRRDRYPIKVVVQGYSKTLTISQFQYADTGKNICKGDNEYHKYYRYPIKVVIQAPTTVDVQGRWGDWGQWLSECPCGGGKHTRFRKRSCTSPTQHILNDCPGYPISGIEHQDCIFTPCPVDGTWNDWSAWGKCYPACGDRIKQNRTRTCTLPQHGGKNCPGDSEEVQNCPINPCPVDGQWGGWYGWNSCSVSCGGGHQTRRRECNSPEPKHGGKYCVGDSGETRACSTQPCPKWHDWEQWGTCSASCGYGKRTRTRICEQCEHPPRQMDCTTVGNHKCKNGSNSGTMNCKTDVCLGHLSHSMQLTCDLGYTHYQWEKPPSSQLIIKGYNKIQEIDSLQYHDAGNYTCGGYNRRDGYPIKVVVQVDGQWGGWYGWNSCSVSCGGGHQTRRRECNSPEPKHGGKYCVGDSGETRACSTQPCPKWHDWEQWGTCSASCGYGKRTRTRICEQCEHPPRQMDCTTVENHKCKNGSNSDTMNCKTDVCLGNLSHSLQLTCDLGYTHYQWEKPPSSQLIIKGYSKIQEIGSLQYHDVGNYTCGGYNRRDRYPIKVVVQGKPVVQTIPTKSVHVGDTVVLPCNVSGHPDVETLWWTKDGDQVSSTAGYKGGTKQQPSLTISSIQKIRGGEYVCHGRNSIGIGSSKTNVVIRNFTTKQVCENANASFTCFHEPSMNASEVFWMKDNSRISPHDNRVNGSTVSHPSLIIMKAKIEDSGLYQCHVINTEGETRGDIIKLNVKALVSIAPSIPVIESTEGSNKTLPCDFESCVKPSKVYWTKRSINQRVDDDEKTQIPKIISEPSMVIHSVNINDSGIYTCHVTTDTSTFTGEDIILLVKATQREHNSQTKENNSAIVAVASSCGTLLCLVIIVGVVKKVKKHFPRRKLSVTVATNNAENATHGSCEINPNVDESNNIYEVRNRTYDNTEHVYEATNQHLRSEDNKPVSNKGQQTSTDPDTINVYDEIDENKIKVTIPLKGHNDHITRTDTSQGRESAKRQKTNKKFKAK